MNYTLIYHKKTVKDRENLKMNSKIVGNVSLLSII
jgi:hypothetical protein